MLARTRVKETTASMIPRQSCSRGLYVSAYKFTETNEHVRIYTSILLDDIIQLSNKCSG